MSAPRRMGPQRQRESRPQREARRTREAVQALEAAAGECAFCRCRPLAMKAVFIDHEEPRRRSWAAVCLDQVACDRQLRASLREDGE